MTATNVRVQMQQRRDTAANWTAAGPTLLAGEIGYETDTGRIKIGDGSTAWASLAYLPIPSSTGELDDDLTITGNLTVQGTTTTIESTTLTIEDKNIEMAVVDAPTDATADGGGITLKGATDKTINWVDATDAWTFSEHIDIASAKEFRIAGTKVLDATSLGSAVVGSSLTSVGTIGTGTWQGTAIDAAYLDPTVVTTGDTGSVTSTMILDGTIVNDDINASAAIAGTKIDPDFGSQTVETTGVFSAASGAAATPSITFTGDLNTGIYSPGADQLAISTNGTQRMLIEADGDINIDSGGVFYDATNNRLAIGTTSADGMLHIKGSGTHGSLILEAGGTSGTTNLMYLQGHNNAGTAIGEISFDETATDQGGLTFKTNGGTLTTKMTLTSAGNVGIGTTSPAGPLEIKFAGNDNGLFITAEDDTSWGYSPNIYFRSELTIGAGPGISGRISSVYESSNNFGMSFYTTAAGSNGEKVRIDSSGRVGIGVSTMAGGGGDVTIIRNSALRWAESDGTQRADIYGDLNSNIVFRNGTSSTERMRIDSSGRLLVGTTTEGYAGAETLTVANSFNAGITIRTGTGSNGSLAFSDGTSGADEYRGLVQYRHADNSMNFFSNGVERMKITSSGKSEVLSTEGNVLGAATTTGAGTSSYALYVVHSRTSLFTGGVAVFGVFTNGNAVNTNDSYGAISDIKLKENIVDAGSQWDDFKAIRFRKYNFKEETGHETFTQLGVIAQELEQVCPGLVDETPDRDEEGNDLGTTTKSVKYSILTKKALVALQEAMERIETLEASNADLLARVSALEAS